MDLDLWAANRNVLLSSGLRLSVFNLAEYAPGAAANFFLIEGMGAVQVVWPRL